MGPKMLLEKNLLLARKFGAKEYLEFRKDFKPNGKKSWINLPKKEKKMQKKTEIIIRLVIINQSLKIRIRKNLSLNLTRRPKIRKINRKLLEPLKRRKITHLGLPLPKPKMPHGFLVELRIEMRVGRKP